MAMSTAHPDEFSPGDPGSAPSWTGPGDRLHSSVEHHDRVTIIHVHGEIDFITAGGFRDHVVGTALARTPPYVVLDLDRVTFCDSSGLSALIVIWKATRAGRGGLVVARPPELCRRILQRTGLDERIGISPTLQHAVAQFADATKGAGAGRRMRRHA